MDCSLLGSSVHGSLQVGTLEWVAMPFSRYPSAYMSLLSYLSDYGLSVTLTHRSCMQDFKIF